jgi:hypothetical protein
MEKCLQNHISDPIGIEAVSFYPSLKRRQKGCEFISAILCEMPKCFGIQRKQLGLINYGSDALVIRSH